MFSFCLYFYLYCICRYMFYFVLLCQIRLIKFFILYYKIGLFLATILKVSLRTKIYILSPLKYKICFFSFFFLKKRQQRSFKHSQFTCYPYSIFSFIITCLIIPVFNSVQDVLVSNHLCSCEVIQIFSYPTHNISCSLQDQFHLCGSFGHCF